jgi:hypothetical protein
MRIYGFFDEQFEPPAPFIKATLEFERLGFTFPISFHIDTGAAVTALLGRDIIYRYRLVCDRGRNEIYLERST